MKKYINLKNNIDYTEIEEVDKIIKNGGIVVFPTETVYGIGTNGLDEDAVKKLYDVKERALNKPISLLVSDINMINQVAKDITDVEYKLMEEFFPGPFTIILKKKENVIPNVVTANKDTIGIRIPDDEIARKLIECANVPLATTSANISGMPSGTNLNDIVKSFDRNVDCFVDGGESKLGTASTIVEVIDGIPHILRLGTITKEQIENIAGCVSLDI